jgi:hypothetical protein
MLVAMAALAATGFNAATASATSKLSREEAMKNFAPPQLPMSNPRHTPRGYSGRPAKGWRAEQSRRRHKEMAKRQKRNRR